MRANTGSTPTGQTVTFTGTVLPDKAGQVIYLQKLGKDGDFHTVEIGFVRGGSMFQFRYTIGSPGTHPPQAPPSWHTAQLVLAAVLELDPRPHDEILDGA